MFKNIDIRNLVELGGHPALKVSVGGPANFETMIPEDHPVEPDNARSNRKLGGAQSGEGHLCKHFGYVAAYKSLHQGRRNQGARGDLSRFLYV